MSFFDIEKFIHENEIDTIEIGFGDINGVLRGKSIPARYFLKNIHQGFEFSNAPFAWDIQCGTYDDLEEGDFSSGLSDIIAMPILSTLKKVPWREHTAFLLCEIRNSQREVLEVDPREVLKRVVARANKLGYRPIIGLELEFYLLDENKEPLFNDTQCYSLYRGGEKNYVLREMSKALEQQGIHIESFHVEYGASQFEVVTECGDAIEIADQLLLIKHTIKEVARSHGLIATFMPKPWSKEQGSELHVHQSLWDLNQQVNYFEKDLEIMDKYLAGLLSYVREMTVLGAPSINAYKRFTSKAIMPRQVTAAEDNRTVAVRSLIARGNASRIEYRLGSSDANPYLIIAGCLAAGINGLENKLFISKNTEGQSYVKRAALVPLSLEEALNLFENSRIANEYFGGRFVKCYTTLGRREVELFRGVITEWERARYLDSV